MKQNRDLPVVPEYAVPRVLLEASLIYGPESVNAVDADIPRSDAYDGT